MQLLEVIFAFLGKKLLGKRGLHEGIADLFHVQILLLRRNITCGYNLTNGGGGTMQSGRIIRVKEGLP